MKKIKSYENKVYNALLREQPYDHLKKACLDSFIDLYQLKGNNEDKNPEMTRSKIYCLETLVKEKFQGMTDRCQRILGWINQRYRLNCNI